MLILIHELLFMCMPECRYKLLSMQLPVDLGVRFPGTKFTYDCETVYLYWELNLGPLEEQSPGSITELFLQLSQCFRAENNATCFSLGRNSSRNLEARTETWPRRKTSYWLVSPTPGLLSYHYYTTKKDHLPRDGTTHRRLSPHASIINQENAPHMCLQTNLVEEIPQVISPLSRWL